MPGVNVKFIEDAALGRRFIRAYRDKGGTCVNEYVLEGKGAHTIEHSHKGGHWIEAERPVLAYVVGADGPVIDKAEPFTRLWVEGGLHHMVIATEDGETLVRCRFETAEDFDFVDPYYELSPIENLPAKARTALDTLAAKVV